MLLTKIRRGRAHRIGWSEKALGLREILDEIGLGEASCLFIDDNPVERQKIRRNLRM